MPQAESQSGSEEQRIFDKFEEKAGTVESVRMYTFVKVDLYSFEWFALQIQAQGNAGCSVKAKAESLDISELDINNEKNASATQVWFSSID